MIDERQDMKKIATGIIVILCVVALSLGCTKPGKTYSKSGVSFNYPGDWDELTGSASKTVGGDLIAILTKPPDDALVIIRKPMSRGESLKQSYEKYKEKAEGKGYKFVSEKTRTIDGNSAFHVTEKNPQEYETLVTFHKNGIVYVITFVSKTNDEKTLDDILNSMKIN